MPPINLQGDDLVADLAQCVDVLSARHKLPEEDVMSALFACIACSAVTGGASRAQFCEMAGALFDDVRGGSIAALPSHDEPTR